MDFIACKSRLVEWDRRAGKPARWSCTHSLYFACVSFRATAGAAPTACMSHASASEDERDATLWLPDLTKAAAAIARTA